MVDSAPVDIVSVHFVRIQRVELFVALRTRSFHLKLRSGLAGMSTLVFRDCRAQSLNTYYNTRVKEKCRKGVQIRNNSRLQKVKTLRYESVLVQPGGFLYHNIPLHPSLGLFQLL